MMARVTMLAMHRDGLIVLPPPRGRQNRPRPIASLGRTRSAAVPGPDNARRGPPARSADRRARDPEGKLWNEFVARYHYLGYKTLVGRPDALCRP